MPELYSLADAILEVAPNLEGDIRRCLAWYRRNGNIYSGVQEFKELYSTIMS